MVDENHMLLKIPRRVCEITVTLRVGDPFTGSTHLREVAYCDVIKRQMTSWLTLSGDVRQKLAFKENSIIFARIFTKQWIKMYFSPSRMLTTRGGGGDRARTLMSRMETRASSLIIFFHICRLSKANNHFCI